MVGIDADAASMLDASRRASRPPARGGAPNAVFVASSLEALPAELGPFADRVTIHLPWGSLLRGLVSADAATLASLARLARPGATITVLLSVEAVDAGAGLGPLAEDALSRLASRAAEHALELTECRPATAADVAAAHSSWGKRLGVGTRRRAWLLRFVAAVRR